MAAVTFEGGYASPMLRKAVFDLLHPGAVVEYEVVRLEDAFPEGHTDVGETGAVEAVICTIILDDGTYFCGAKEMARRGKRQGGSVWEDRPPTPEAYASDSTKALGRAMRDAGIPMHVGELKLLLNFLKPPAPAPRPTLGRKIDPVTGEVEPVELTLEQVAVASLNQLQPAQKSKVAEWGKSSLGITNIMRPGEHAQAVIDHIKELRGDE